MNKREFDDLYTRYAPAVRARCRAMCGNPVDADEALQDTFLRAWRARRRFDGRHPLAWLQTIARNTCVDLLRRRRPWVDEPRAWLDLPDAPVSMGARLDSAKLLSGFNPEDAAILRLRHAEGWRIHEIAEHFDTSSRTLRRRLERIERRARAILGISETSHVH
ncbi:MAG: sigma-70 family RNA polymerase sigma factor [Myxococcota bacterium]